MLIDETVQPLDVWTTIDLGMQRAADAVDQRQCAARRAGRAGLARPRRRGAGDGRRAQLCELDLQPRHPGDPPARLLVQAVRLSDRAGSRATGRTRVVEDGPITIGGWSPRNDNGRYVGPVPLRAAFAYSINTVAVRLAQDVGTRSVADMAQRFGITSRVDTNPSMALGTSEVRLIDMTRAYAAVARGGIAVTPYGIRRVTTADGTLLYQHEDDETRVLVQPWVAAQMTDLLQGVVAHGTGQAAGLGRPTAGKTGTTTSNKDGWFIGFSSGLTTGVWMGRDDNRALARPRRRPRPGARLPRLHGPRRRQPDARGIRHRDGGARLADRAERGILVHAAGRRSAGRRRRQSGRAGAAADEDKPADEEPVPGEEATPAGAARPGMARAGDRPGAVARAGPAAPCERVEPDEKKVRSTRSRSWKSERR